MPNTRISDLTAATSVAGTDVYPSVQTAGVGPVKTSLTQITAFALANAPAGAVATPSIAPTGDTNTGFWFPAADTIAASTGGSERMRITSAGNVGIGTTSPAVRLSVEDTSGSARIQVKETTTNNLIQLEANTAFHTLFSTGNVPLYIYTQGQIRQTITGAGNVGIGTTSPTAYTGYTTLEVKGVSGGGGGLFKSTSSDGVTSAEYYSVSGAGTFFGTTTAHPLIFITSGTEKMRITSAGNVGIGTASPVSPLSVNGIISLRKSDAAVGNIVGDRSVTVTGGGAAVQILTGTSQLGSIGMVSGGVVGVNAFCDIICWVYSGPITVLQSTNIVGSPGARTYTSAAGQLSLAIAGSGTYICGGCVLSHGT